MHRPPAKPSKQRPELPLPRRARLLPSKACKAGFNFGLYRPQRDADPTPICALSLRVLRKQLVSHGYGDECFNAIQTIDGR